MEKKLMSEVEELQQREQRALQSQSHLDERRMHAMERMESTR